MQTSSELTIKNPTDLSQVKLAKTAQPFIQTDLKQICEEVVSDLEVKIVQTQAEVEIGDVPVISADALQMR